MGVSKVLPRISGEGGPAKPVDRADEGSDVGRTPLSIHIMPYPSPSATPFSLRLGQGSALRLSQNANRTGGVRDSLLIMGRKQELIKKGNIKKAINEVAKML